MAAVSRVSRIGGLVLKDRLLLVLGWPFFVFTAVRCIVRRGVSEDEGKKICAGSFGFLQAVHTVWAIFHSFPTSPIRNQFYLVAGGLVCRDAETVQDAKTLFYKIIM